jgi:ABC-2 type transport system permease protein
MSAELAVAVPATASGKRTASSVIARYTARRSLRSAVVWGYVFGVTVASSAVSYTRLYKTAAERQRLAQTFGANHAAAALFGPAPDLQTVAGFTVLKASMTLIIIGAVWALLTSTRLLRGDEDSGRWEILASGLTTRGRAAAAALGGLGVGVTTMWALTALLTIAVGRLSSVRIDVTAGLYFAVALVTSAVMFLAVGAVTSQLASSRRQAAGYAAVVLGVSYGLRMIADSGTGLHWLVWVSPLGWVEQLQPLTAPRPWALLPIAAFTAALALIAVVLAGHRDVGAGTFRSRTTRAARLRLLSGSTGLTVRLTRSSAIWWAAAIAICGLMIGVVAKAAGSTVTGSSVEQVLSRLGAAGTGTLAFLGVTFMIIAIVLSAEAAAQVSAARAEEAEGRLDHLLVGTASRVRWLVGRLGIAALALVLSGVAAGLFTWIGAVSQRSGVSIWAALDAGINTIPPAIFVLGVGALALGLWPRRAAVAVYLVLGWSALIELTGGFVGENHWVVDTSLFHQMASAPAVRPDWMTNGILIAAALLAMAVGTAAIRRRDLAGE